MKIYCEHGALTKELKLLRQAGKITLINFRYDPGSRPRKINPTALPSAVRYEDLNLNYNEFNFDYGDLQGSAMLTKIIQIVGPTNRRDALHVDSAHKSNCRAFITRDADILDHSEKLERLLGIRIINPDTDHDVLLKFLSESEAD
jgi:hypothetical protein